MLNNMLTSTIQANIDSGTLRVILRVYFIAIIFLLGIIGRQCCKLAVKKDLLDGHQVRIHRMTGWLKSEAILDATWKLRRLPGGWFLGILMIIATAISLTADIVVANMVLSTPTPGYCDFDQGLVMDWDHDESFSDPPSNSWVASVASNAQYISSENNCDVGIYKKIPGNPSTDFCGNFDDVLGRWQCPNVGKNKTFSANANVQTIVNSLYSDGLQYNKSDTAWIDLQYNNMSAHLAIWSSSAPSDDSRKPFDVLVSADTSAEIGDAVVMTTYNCSVANSTNITAVNKILQQIQSHTALHGWQAGLEAVLYSGANTGIGDLSQQSLEIYLNSMTMVQGGNDSIVSNMLSTDNWPYYGCLTRGSSIARPVLLMVALAAILFLIVAGYYLLLLLTLNCGSSEATRGRKNIKPIPDDTLTWVLQAARESVISTEASTGEDGRPADVPRKVKEMRDWRFEITDSVAGVARITREKEGCYRDL